MRQIWLHIRWPRKHTRNTLRLIDNSKFWVIKRRTWLIWVLSCLILLLPSWATWYWYHYGGLTDDQGNPLDFEKLRKKKFYIASYVYDLRGRQMDRFFYEARDCMRLNEIPRLVQQAFIAAEDQNFYAYHFNNIDLTLPFGHFGIDPKAILRAFFLNEIHKYTGYGNKSGGSTIDVQTVRLLYEEDVMDFKNRAQTYPRKVREARIAVKLNDLYSKDEILEGFLNLPYFGHGANGVAEAWRVYFGKDLRRVPVTIREVAMITALNKSPGKF